MATGRPRWFTALAIFATIGLGLASRRYSGLFPVALGKYPGDALWAQMVYWGLAWLFPAASSTRLATSALAISCVDEFTQLYQGPWINQIRATTAGHLVLGSVFSWHDMLAYTVGIAIVAVLDALAFRRGRPRRDA